jgi:tetratricopeptide (TPR) repeat protein
LDVEEFLLHRQSWRVPKHSSKQASRRASGAAIVLVVLVVLAGVALTMWLQRPVARTSPSEPESVTNQTAEILSDAAVRMAAPPTNRFDQSGFEAWLTNQTNVDTLLSMGARMLEHGEVKMGALSFLRAVELKRDHEEAWFNLGVAQTRLGLLDEAEEAYHQAISNFVEYAEARNNLGNLLTRQKRYAEAIEQFNTVIEQAPDNATAHNNLGRALAEQGDSARALQRFREAARLDPQYLDAHFNIGSALLVMGQTNEAVAAFRDVLRLKPDFAPALNALAKLRKQP